MFPLFVFFPLIFQNACDLSPLPFLENSENEPPPAFSFQKKEITLPIYKKYSNPYAEGRSFTKGFFKKNQYFARSIIGYSAIIYIGFHLFGYYHRSKDSAKLSRYPEELHKYRTHRLSNKEESMHFIS